MLAVLYLITAAGLAVSAVALWGVRDFGSVRALAVMLGLNAAMITVSALWALGLDAWWLAWPPVGMARAAAYAASPALLALAFLRARTGGPLLHWDHRLVWAYALAGAGLYFAAVESREAYTMLRFVVLNAFALGAIWVAGRIVAAWTGPERKPLATVLGVYTAHWAFSTAGWVGSIRDAGWAPVAEALSVALLLAFGLVVGGLGLRRFARDLDVFNTADTADTDDDDTPPPPADPADEILADALTEQLDGERVYLDPDLTLDALASTVRALPRDVSRVLGARFGGGFHAAVAQRRVAEAKRLLLAEPDATILDVLYRAGFNSKSAFHRVFRAQVGMTPSEYRRDPAAELVSEVPLPEAGRQTSV